MSKKRKAIGECHICGTYGELSEEHVPPKKAFNNHRYYIHLINTNDPFSEPLKKYYAQGGVRFPTLCNRCNNNTGSWYSKAYIDWCFFGMDVLRRSKGKPSLYYFNKIFPLRVIKQIIVMMFSVNGIEFRKINPSLEEFVLNKDRKNLPPEYKVFVYYNYEGSPRYSGYTAIGNFEQNSEGHSFISEVTYPPYGFVLTMQNSPPPDKRLTEITYFADFQYSTEWEVDLYLNPLPTWSLFPGDYRQKSEIEEAIRKSKNTY